MKTVVIACKLPHGIIIRDQEETIVHENVMGGGTRKVKLYRPVGPRIRVKGPVVPDAFIRSVEVVGGYAITEGVDADVFGRWMNWNKDAPYVVNKLIYGHEDRDNVLGWAREHGDVRSGVEPLDVTMKTHNGRQVYADERIARAGADLVVDGKVAAA
jgi:hypothetical protein